MSLIKLEKPDYYLKSGKMTQPFFENAFIIEKVNTDIENTNLQGDYKEIISLLLYINHKIKRFDDIKNVKFSRTAEQIFKSGYTSGCHDHSLVFATFARQLNIPTTMLETVAEDCLYDIKNNINNIDYVGHSFCECYINNKWILIDPTNGVIYVENYDINNIKIPFKSFKNLYSFDRCIDFSEFDVKDTKSYTDYMNNKCKSL